MSDSAAPGTAAPRSESRGGGRAWRGGGLVMVGIALAACASPAGGGDQARRWRGARRNVVQPPPQVEYETLRPTLSEGYAPDVLEPPAASDDAVLVRVGDLEIRKSYAFDRLLQMDAVRTRQLCQRLAWDALVAAYARRHGITVQQQEIDDALAAEERSMREALASAGSPVSDEEFRLFVESRFGIGLADYRRVYGLELARQRYRGYVVRYLRLLEEQMVLRGLWNRDRQLVANLAERVREGADFGMLARRHSDHQSAREGGLLPPLGAGFDTPLTRAAFELQPGEVSAVLEVESDSGVQFAILYCLERRPARAVAFEDVREELRAQLQETPVTDAEYEAFLLRWSPTQPELDTTPSSTGR